MCSKASGPFQEERQQQYTHIERTTRQTPHQRLEHTPAVKKGCFLGSQAYDALIPGAHGKPTRSNARPTGCLYLLVDFLQASPQCPLPVLLFAYRNVLSAPATAGFADISVSHK